MKAQVLVKNGDSKNCFVEMDQPVPSIKEDEILIQTQYSGLNFADVMARKGSYRDAPELPSVLGYDVHGTVEKVGPNIKDIKQGDSVLAFTRFGGYAEKVVAPKSGVVKIPSNLDGAASTALATQYCTAYFMAYYLTKMRKGDHVLIQAAAGGVGTALVQMAKHAGCIIYGTAGSKEKIEYIKELGVTHPINYREKDFFEEVMRIGKGRKLDLVFDSLGGKAFKKGFKLLGTGGRICCFGAASRSHGFLSLPKLLMGFGFYLPPLLMMNTRSILGVNMLKLADERPDILNYCLDEVVKLYDQNILKPHVSKVFDAKDVFDAQQFMEKRSSIGKVVLKW